MLNLKKLQFLLTIITLFISINMFAQFKKNGKTYKSSAFVIKDSIKTKIETQSDSSALKMKMFLNRKSFDTIFLNDLSEYLINLSHINFLHGKIFFTGNGFPQTVSANFYGNLIESKTFENFFIRCVSGSRIVFENCVYKKMEGATINSFNRSIVIR